MENNITFVGMDTHKKEHSVALHYPGEQQVVRLTVRNTVREIAKMVKKIVKMSPGEVRFCYEAGVCGFTLKRRIETHGCKCAVIAPSLIPVKPGDRVKTDRRDAKKLMELFKAGLLTEVYTPDKDQESARELTRCRQSAQENLKRIRHQLLKFLTRHGYIYTDGHHWTQKHIDWLGRLELDDLLLRDVLNNYLTEMEHCLQRLHSLEQDVEKLAQRDPYKEIVGLLRCFHGINTLSAITMLTEIFEFGRFSNPDQLMSYLGLVPSQHSSGEKERRGSITKAGNKRVRRLFTEIAWHYRHPYNAVSKALRLRRQDQPEWAINIANNASRRLRKRYWYLINRGKPPCKVVIAIARELAGFIWAILNEYQMRKQQAA